MPDEFDLKELELLAERIEANLHLLHWETDRECEDIAKCPKEHFDPGRDEFIAERQVLLQKLDRMIDAKRMAAPEDQNNDQSEH